MLSNKRFRKRVNKKIRKRTRYMYLFIILCLTIIVGRLMYIYFFQSEKYSKDALQDRNLADQTIQYRRGDIMDRNGVVLAKSEVSYNLILDRVELKNEAINEKTKLQGEKSITDTDFESSDNIRSSVIERTFRFIQSKYKISYKSLEEQYLKNKDSRYIILKKDLNNNEAQIIKDKWNDQKEDAKDTISVNGIWLENKYKRVYPFKELASNLIGFVNDVGDPIIGVESSYDSVLRGKNGRNYQYYDSTLGIVRKNIAAQDGNNVKLTIDIGIQKLITDKIKDYYKQVKYKDMAILVMNPSNGEILGMAATPLFDLNNPTEHDDIIIPDKIVKSDDGTEKYEKQEWKDLTTEEQSRLLNEKWANKTVSLAFEPGSTFKPITFAAGLELKKFDLETQYYCDGGEQIADKYIRCSNVNGHGSLTAAQAIEVSCNDALMRMGAQIGAKDFLEYQKVFNFGRQTGIDLPNEIGGPTLVHTLENMGPVDLATNSFGQNFNVNMVQLAAADGAIGNNGKYYRPHIGYEITDSNNSLISRIEPELIRQVISKETAYKTKTAMRMVVEEGYMKKWGIIPGYEHQLFGKTGTAEKQPREANKYITSFIEMAPFDNPELLIYVLIDEPEIAEEATADASLISTEIMKELLPTLDIKPGISSIEKVDNKETNTNNNSQNNGQQTNSGVQGGEN